MTQALDVRFDERIYAADVETLLNIVQSPRKISTRRSSSATTLDCTSFF